MRAAAQTALARGAPETAVAYLRRALAEPPREAEAADVLLELGQAEARSADPECVGHLREAAERARHPAQRALALHLLSFPLLQQGRVAEAVDLLAAASESLPGELRELRLLLEVDIAAAENLDSSVSPGRRLDRLADEIDGGTAIGRLALAALAYDRAKSAQPSARVAELAERALGDGHVGSDAMPEAPPFAPAVAALLAAERFASALRYIEEGFGYAREHGSVFAFAVCSWMRAQYHLRRGELGDAETDAAISVEAARTHGWSYAVPAGAACLVDALVAQGKLDEAAAALDAPDLALVESPLTGFDFLLEARARLNAARQDLAPAVADATEAGRRYARWGVRNPAISPWRSDAARWLAALGRRDEALRLADQAVALAAQFGSPTATGVALRARGVALAGTSGIDVLFRSVAELEPTEARLELASALTDLGAALRRANRRGEAADALGRALPLAEGCGAGLLAERIQRERAALGLRVAKRVAVGADALTPSERRVAQLAARGLSNREIAQALFVTVKTVETHLGNAYRKLRIRSRVQLVGALSDAREPPGERGTE